MQKHFIFTLWCVSNLDSWNVTRNHALWGSLEYKLWICTIYAGSDAQWSGNQRTEKTDFRSLWKETAGDIKWANPEIHFLKAGIWNDQWERMILYADIWQGGKYITGLPRRLEPRISAGNQMPASNQSPNSDKQITAFVDTT